MAGKCSRCDLGVGDQKDGVKCPDCSKTYHLGCVGVVTRNRKWKCEGCAKDALDLESSSNSSRAGDSGTANSAVLDAIAAFRKENNERWDANEEKLSKVQLNIDSVRTEMLDLKTQFADVKKSSAVACESVDALKTENERLSEELTRVKVEVQDLQQHTRKNNILVSGVPSSNKEDILAVLADIARVLNVNFHPADISAAHRLQGKRGDARPPSIVVCFTSRLVKTHWLAARREKGSLSARDLRHFFPDSQIYLNEHLTPETRAIFNAARGLRKDRKLLSVWTSDCRVMAKASVEQRPFRVMDLEHVARLSAATVTPTPLTPVSTTNNTPPSDDDN